MRITITKMNPDIKQKLIKLLIGALVAGAIAALIAPYRASKAVNPNTLSVIATMTHFNRVIAKDLDVDQSYQ